MTLNTQSIASILRQIAAIAAVVIGAIPADSLPAAVRVPLIAAGGVVLAVEHYLSDPSTGTPPSAPTATPPAVLPPAAPAPGVQP